MPARDAGAAGRPAAASATLPSLIDVVHQYGFN